jgi:hypothetical protein
MAPSSMKAPLLLTWGSWCRAALGPPKYIGWSFERQPLFLGSQERKMQHKTRASFGLPPRRQITTSDVY